MLLETPPLRRVKAGLERVSSGLGERISPPLAAHTGRAGKLLRARYALLLARALGVAEDVAEGVARTAELLHNASLLHDDCIDEASLRRGEPTPNALFGDRCGILLGDLAFAAALVEAAAISPRAVRLLAGAVRDMAVGQVQELFLRESLNVSLEGYYGIAARKTGAPFEWVGRVLSLHSLLPHRGADPGRLGLLAGVVLQIVDDVLDYSQPEEATGKAPGRDLATGRLTLPGILAMDDEGTREVWLGLWGRRGEPGALEQARALLASGGHLERARAIAREVLLKMDPLIGALPRAGDASRLKDFLDQMARREA